MLRRAVLVLPLLLVVLGGCITAPAPGAPPLDPPEAAPWPGNVQVTTGNGPASELSLAINPLDPLNMVGGAKDYTLGSDPGPGCTEYNVWSGVYVTKDGGLTWDDFLMPGFPGDTNTTLLSHYNCNSDPVVVFGPDGTAYYSGLAYAGTPNSQGGTGLCPEDPQATLCGRSIWIAKSADGGSTWGDFVNVVAADDGNTILDKQWFAVNPTDPQHLVMTWIWFQGFSGRFYISESRDGAATWSPPLELAGFDTPAHQNIMPAFGPDGTIYLIWRQFGVLEGTPVTGLPVDTGLGEATLMFTRSVAPGVLAFPPAMAVRDVNDVPEVPGEEFRVNSLPVMSVDLQTGTIYVVWPDQREGHSDIVLVKSEDGGATWTEPVTVNQDAGANDQFMNWMVVDEEGGVNVVFYDRAYTNNTQLDLTLARSTDAGATWRSWRVTSASWAMPEGCYHQAGFPFLGDYIAVVAGGGVVHPFWADGRTGRCDAFTAALPLEALGGAAGGDATGQR